MTRQMPHTREAYQNRLTTKLASRLEETGPDTPLRLRLQFVNETVAILP